MLDPARLVFIDETAVSTNLVRLRGRAPRGDRVIGSVPLGARETITFGSRRRALSVTADPNEASAHNNRGRVLADQERFDDAIEQYRQADALWQKKESKDRKRALCHWAEKRALCNWADALREQEHYEQAAEKCRQAIGLDSEFPDAYNSLGLARAAQERFDDAIEQYRQADALWQEKESKNAAWGG